MDAARGPRVMSGEGTLRTSGRGLTGCLLGGAGVRADSRICSLHAAHLHRGKVVGCNQAYSSEIDFFKSILRLKG